jgi:anthranilate 1,2-dioxygenase (deaminating, decarboxylating) large subunit
MLVWTPRPIAGGMLFSHRVTADIVMPTGKYSHLDPVNPSNHVVSVNPWYAFTLYPKKHSMKFEISSRIHYLWNGENDDPFVGYRFKSVQPGQAFHENYTVSYEFAKGIRLGFNGYAVQQITDNKINGANQANSRERLFGSGPGAQFGGHGLWFYINAYWEGGAQNTAQGTHVNFRVLKTLGGGEQGPPPAPAPKS